MCLCADQWLIVHRQFAIGNCVAKVFLDLPTMLGAILQIARIESILASPAPLGGVEREIGGLDQFLGVEPVIRCNRDAN